MSRRLKPTLADYVVIAINPVLIMGLVGSLIYFLLEILYGGHYPDRLQFCLTMFVFAIVLISRISMEDGFERAAPFGIALAVVVGIALNRYVDYHGAVGRKFWLDHQLEPDGPHLVVRPQTDLGLHHHRRKRRSRRAADCWKPPASNDRRTIRPTTSAPAAANRATAADPAGQCAAAQRALSEEMATTARPAESAPHARRLDRLFFARLVADLRPRPTLHSRREHGQPPLRLFAAVRLRRLWAGTAADDQLPLAPPLPALAAAGDAGRDGGQLAGDRRRDGRRRCCSFRHCFPALPRNMRFRHCPAKSVRPGEWASPHQRGQRRRSRSRGRQRFGRRPFAQIIVRPASPTRRPAPTRTRHRHGPGGKHAGKSARPAWPRIARSGGQAAEDGQKIAAGGR